VWSTTGGTITWVVWASLWHSPLVELLLALSPLVLVPLLLRATVDDVEQEGSLPWRVAVLAQLPCAALVVVSFVQPPGEPATAALCLPWAGVTGLMALHGLARWRRRRSLVPAGALAIDAGLCFPVVGAGWLLLSRLGETPMDFSPIIVLLTAVHFHYAGLVLPIVAGLCALELGGKATPIAAVGVLIGVPLVAAGITYSPALEMVGALLTAGSAFAIGVAQIRCGWSRNGIAAALFGLSGLSLMMAMCVAGIYAIGESMQRPWPSIADMIPMHGAINALGFGVLGAWAWNLRPARDAQAEAPQNASNGG
jgi:hypothetical protein